MDRILALFLLIALGTAGENAGQATPFHWKAGSTTLADAVDALRATGNAIWLAEGVDDRQIHEIAAVDGVWWDGVVAMCNAFNLCPDPGDPSDDQLDLPGTPIPVGHGGVILSPGTQQMQVQGSLLAVIAGTGDNGFRLWLRAEPRLPRGALAWAKMEEIKLIPQLVGLELADVREDGQTMWHLTAAVPAGTRLQASVKVAGFHQWTASASLTVGKPATMTVTERTISAMMIIDPLLETWEGATLPERRPLIAVVGPQDLLQRANLRLRQGESELASRGSSTRQAGDRFVQLRYLRSVPEGAVDLQLDGRLMQSPDQLAILLPLPSEQPPKPIAISDAPSILTWAAGTGPLSDWVRRLSATGNPVLIEVGLDTRAMITLPAFRGNFWDGVRLLCGASSLAPALADDAALGGGAVRLVQRNQAANTATGPLLLVASRVDIRDGRAVIQLQSALEPRLSVDHYGPPTVAWASWAIDPAGAVHPLRETTNKRDGRIQTEITVTPSTPGLRQVQLSGMIQLPRIRNQRLSVTLVPDQPVELPFAGRAIQFRVLPAPISIGNSQYGPGLLVRGLVGFDQVAYALIGTDGQQLENGTCNRASGMPGTYSWLARTRIPLIAGMQVDLLARVEQPPMILPFTLQVPLPEGL